ncbi:MAG TPA: hypothetical protein VFN67_18515 [Polyangiales bacterium]|nr:hypothetical protein [Polyangiales bacterium]
MLDETPGAYKDIGAVMDAHLVYVVHTFKQSGLRERLTLDGRAP